MTEWVAGMNRFREISFRKGHNFSTLGKKKKKSPKGPSVSRDVAMLKLCHLGSQPSISRLTFFLFKDRVSPCSPGCLGMCFVEQPGLKLMVIHLHTPL